MKILYVGPIDEVEVPYEEDGRQKVFVAKRNEAVECPAELAELLLEQKVWEADGLRTAPGTGKKTRGKKVAIGESATITGDGSGESLPPVEPEPIATTPEA